MMTLEEAILHCEEVAEINEDIAYNIENDNWMAIGKCQKCAEEHRQLAEWLRELKKLREQSKPGRWIIYTVSPIDGQDVMCSECGQRGCATYWDYCPNCGAKMEVTE